MMSSRFDEHAESSRAHDRILASAARLFREHGLDATTMADIARAADCSEASLYRHYSSRKQVLYALAEQLFEDIPRMFAIDFPSAPSLQRKIELMVRHQLDWFLEHRDLVLLHSHLPTELDLNRLLVNYMAVWLQRSASDVEELNGHDSELLALHLVGVLQSAFQRSVAGPVAHPHDVLAAMTEIFFHGAFPRAVGVRSWGQT